MIQTPWYVSGAIKLLATDLYQSHGVEVVVLKHTSQVRVYLCTTNYILNANI